MQNSNHQTTITSTTTSAAMDRATPMPVKPRRRKRRWRSADDRQKSSIATPTLRFNPTAWAKLVFLRDYGPTEVGGFAVTAQDDLLYIEDVVLVKQSCTGMSVAFDDTAVADFFDRQVDEGRKIEQFARIWVHTHPGDCPRPSYTDENTFLRVFGKNDWTVMFILAQSGESYARLKYNLGPGGSLQLPVAVDYSRPFDGSDYGTWEEEYLVNVQEPEPTIGKKQSKLLLPETIAKEDLSPANPENWPFFDRGEFEEFLQFREEAYGY